MRWHTLSSFNWLSFIRFFCSSANVPPLILMLASRRRPKHDWINEFPLPLLVKLWSFRATETKLDAPLVIGVTQKKAGACCKKKIRFETDHFLQQAPGGHIVYRVRQMFDSKVVCEPEARGSQKAGSRNLGIELLPNPVIAYRWEWCLGFGGIWCSLQTPPDTTFIGICIEISATMESILYLLLFKATLPTVCYPTPTSTSVTRGIDCQVSLSLGNKGKLFQNDLLTKRALDLYWTNLTHLYPPKGLIHIVHMSIDTHNT